MAFEAGGEGHCGVCFGPLDSAARKRLLPLPLMDLSKHLKTAADALKRRNYLVAIKTYGMVLGLQPDNGEARRKATRSPSLAAKRAKSSTDTTTAVSLPRRVMVCGPSRSALLTTSLNRFLASCSAQTFFMAWGSDPLTS